jgi:hypothetical protein
VSRFKPLQRSAVPHCFSLYERVMTTLSILLFPPSPRSPGKTYYGVGNHTASLTSGPRYFVQANRKDLAKLERVAKCQFLIRPSHPPSMDTGDMDGAVVPCPEAACLAPRNAVALTSLQGQPLGLYQLLSNVSLAQIWSVLLPL